MESTELNPRIYGQTMVKPMTKEARIYNGAKSASSVSGAGKIGELCVKE